jgi:hypothetical protein
MENILLTKDWVRKQGFEPKYSVEMQSLNDWLDRNNIESVDGDSTAFCQNVLDIHRDGSTFLCIDVEQPDGDSGFDVCDITVCLCDFEMKNPVFLDNIQYRYELVQLVLLIAKKLLPIK